ncbi:phosphoribosyl-ATP diphosphatase [Terrarubrum flagellatum]|uniref:phosphoribosyl-ATP diphosphatase n=1 Tax=Terrirubrum flagellatum TaxID=2895980 RepID=UPI003144D75D
MSDSIERLYEGVHRARDCDPAISRTAKLMAGGIAKMAKKVGEEAVEVGLDAVKGDRSAVIAESADLIYNLVVLWAASGITPEEIWAEMGRRERMMGLAEKMPKQNAKPLFAAMSASR